MQMISGGTMFLMLVIGALTLFGAVLGFASWEDTRNSRRRDS
jgi:hypothetical protein